MIKRAISANLAAIVIGLFAGPVPELSATQPESGVRERQAVITELSANASAITYWTAEPDGCHIVTTIDILLTPGDAAERHGVARFSTVLLPGQAAVISVPYALGKQQQVLRIRRLDDRIVIDRVSASSL